MDRHAGRAQAKSRIRNQTEGKYSDDLHYTPQTKFAADLFCLVLKHAKITTFAVYFKGNSECFGQC